MLGRENTPEETKIMEEGGGTFSKRQVNGHMILSVFHNEATHSDYRFVEIICFNQTIRFEI